MKLLQHYLKAFERIGAHTSQLWAEQQQIALQYLSDNGFPSTKNERWRYIARSPFLQQPFAVETASTVCDIATIEKRLPALQDANTLRFISYNGQLQVPSHLALPAGLMIEPIKQLMDNNPSKLLTKSFALGMELSNSFSALNTLFAQEGLHIAVAENCTIEPLIEIWHVTHELEAPHLFCLRHHIDLGQNSSLKIVQHVASLSHQVETTHINAKNVFTTVNLAKDATLHLAQSANTLDHESYINQLAVQQQQASTLNADSVSIGGGLVRHTFTIDLCEPHAACELRGLMAVKHRQQADYQLIINHGADHTKSDIHYRAIADDNGKASFSGEVIAQKEIKKMSSHQSNDNLLLSDQAEIDTKPRLALWSDEIECTHGATVGALDQEALFYLQSRGFPPEIARSMLIQAFCEAGLSTMPFLSKSSKRIINQLRRFISPTI